MKHKDLLVFLLLLLLLSLFSCTTPASGEEANLQVPSVSAGNNASPAFPAQGWTHETEITHEGSRSEGSVSRLFYRYNELPAVFSRLIIGGHEFLYLPMVNLWDHSGYIYMDVEHASPVKNTSKPINRSELKNGWYQSGYEVIKSGTPVDWIFAESEIISVWASPEKLADVINLFALESLSAQGLMMQPGKAEE